MWCWVQLFLIHENFDKIGMIREGGEVKKIGVEQFQRENSVGMVH
jgi:hypothetical protein